MDTSVVPALIACDGVVVAEVSVLLVPHSKKAVAERPFGLTVPPTVAVLDVTELAAAVFTVATIAVVVRVSIDPFCDPALF